jgi:hypothetical protein
MSIFWGGWSLGKVRICIFKPLSFQIAAYAEVLTILETNECCLFTHYVFYALPSLVSVLRVSSCRKSSYISYWHMFIVGIFFLKVSFKCWKSSENTFHHSNVCFQCLFKPAFGIYLLEHFMSLGKLCTL